MNDFFTKIILQKTGASALLGKEIIQELWSGYGKIMRIGLEHADVKSVIVKHVQFPLVNCIHRSMLTRLARNVARLSL